MLRNLATNSKLYLLYLINTSWTTGCIPNDWKISIITPILKHNKNPIDPASYRHISVTSAISKKIEKMVASRLNWFQDKNNLIYKSQSGFCKFCSCLDNAIRLNKEIKEAFNSK